MDCRKSWEHIYIYGLALENHYISVSETKDISKYLFYPKVEKITALC
jgi:hypothetical protein